MSGDPGTSITPIRVSRGDYAEITEQDGAALKNPAKRGKLTPGMQRLLCRDLAAREITRSAMARKYGITPGYVTQFAKQRAAEIDAMRARLDDEWAGLWVARKEARLAAYEADYDAASQARYSDHHEWIKARTAILKAVAEELGQLPPRQSAAVLVVTHVVEGIDTAELT